MLRTLGVNLVAPDVEDPQASVLLQSCCRMLRTLGANLVAPDATDRQTYVLLQSCCKMLSTLDTNLVAMLQVPHPNGQRGPHAYGSARADGSYQIPMYV